MNELKLPPKVTRNAFEQIFNIGGGQAVLRIAVDGGGCSGFQYRIEMSEVEEDDLVIENGGEFQDTKLVIDPVSLPFLQSAVIDYKNELIGSRFVIENPNTASECGCGTSFSI